MKVGSNLDPPLKEIFKCRFVGNLTTNSTRYHTSKSVSNYLSYRL